jgi:outer membrane cobalamin receptor
LLAFENPETIKQAISRSFKEVVMDIARGNLFILVLLLLLPVNGLSQTGKLRGYVRDAYSGEAIPQAYVLIEENAQGIPADGNGFFEIDDIPAGNITLKISRIGYKGIEHEIKIEAGETEYLKVRLQAEAVKFRKMLITATREKGIQSDVAVTSEIITRSEIRATNSQSVGEILGDVSGLFVKNYGHLGALKASSIRGTSENQVLVLLDGQRLNIAQGIAPDLSDLPLNAIDRIEVIRGGHSALYGTDAVGGVINLITRSSPDGQDISGQISSTIASFGTRIVGADFSQRLGDIDYFLTHNYTESDGEFEFEDPEGNSFERTNNQVKWNDTFLKLRYTLNPTSMFTGYLQYHDAIRGAPGPLSFPSETAQQKDESWKYNIGYERQITPEFHLSTQSLLFRFRQHFDDPEAFTPIHSLHRNDAYGVSLQSNWQIYSGNEVTSGYEFRQDKIESTDISSRIRNIHSVFVQDQIKLPVRIFDSTAQLSLVPAFRTDNYSDVNTQFSPKLGFVFNYVRDFQLIFRGNWGRSYRAPSFNDLYWPLGDYTAGNPDLLPEKSHGFDLGLAMNFMKSGFWGMEVNHYHTSLENLIIWEPGSDFIWRPQNLEEATLKGVETKFSFRDRDGLFYFEADYDYLDAVNGSTDKTLQGKQLIYRPKNKVTLNLKMDFHRVETSGTYRFVGERFTVADNTSSLEGYRIVDVGLTWKQPASRSELRIRTEVRNLLDRQVPVIDGFPVPGRELRTTIGFEF